ncbi:MAG: oligosaccharide flippase family protein [Candidatus Bathyarchaeia archaeon]
MSRKIAAVSWFKRVINKCFARSSFARNVAILAGGTALGQAISVMASPVLTRLYTPDDFGVLAVYSSILGILSVVASWRYELAIPLPEEDEDAVNLVVLSLGIVVLMSCGVGVGVWLLRDQLVQWVNAPALRPYLWLLPVGILLVGSYQVFNYWAIRKQAFGIVAHTKLRQGIGAVATQIGVGLVEPLPLGLLLGQVVGQTAGVLTLLRVFWKQARGSWKNVNSNELAKVSRRYARFPLYASWAGVLNALSVQIPILLLSSFFGTKTTGPYLLAYQVLWFPTQLIGQATTQVLLAAGAGARRRGDITNLAMSTFKRLLLISVPCFSLIGLLAPDVAGFIFGPDWKEAGSFMRWLAPWIFLVFVASPLSAFSIVLEKQPQEVIFQSVLLTSRIGALLGGRKLGSPYVAVGLFSLVSAMCWIGYLVWILSLVRVPLKVSIRLLFEEVVVNLVFFLPLILIKEFVPNSVWLLPGILTTCFLVVARVFYTFRVKGEGDA